MHDSDQQPKRDFSRLISMPQTIGFAILAAIGIWAYWPSVVESVTTWSEDPDYSHGYLVVPLSLFLLWSRRERIDPRQFRLSWVGVSLILVAAIMRYVAGRFYLQEINAWSIPIFIGGLVWTFFGWQAFVWAAPSVFFLWFATPMPETIANWLSRPLQLIAAQSSTIVLQAFGQLAIREGTVILAGDQPLDVARACSGLRMFYGILALAIAFVLVTKTRGWRAVVMIISAPPVAVFANVLRISITVLLYRFTSSEVAEKFMHDLAGIFMLPLAVVMFMLLNGLINRIVTNYGTNPGRTLKRLAAAGGALAVVIVALFSWVTFQQGRATATLLTTVDRYEAEKDWNEASRYLQRYLAVEEDDKDAWLRFIEIAKKSSDDYYTKRQTLSLMRRVWTKFPEEQSLGQQAIELALEIGEDRPAVVLSDRLLAAEPDEQSRRTAIRAKATALPRYLASPSPSNDYEWPQAAEALETAIQELGEDYRFHMTLAELYRQRRVTAKDEDDNEIENNEAADELVGKMIEAFPNEPMPLLARYYYGLAFWNDSEADQNWKDDRTKALELCEAAPEKWTADLYLVAANLAREQDDLEFARTNLRQAIERFPQDSRPYMSLGEIEGIANEEGSSDRKIELFRQAFQNVEEPENELFRILLAYEYAAVGRKDELDNEIKKIQELIPRLRPPMLNLARLSLADINAVALQEQGDIARAAEALEAGLIQDEADLAGTPYAQRVATVGARLGDYYRQLGLHDLAASSYVKVGRIAPAFPEWRMRAANAYSAAGNPEEAIRVLAAEVQDESADKDTLITLAESEIRRQLVTPKHERNWSRAIASVGRTKSAGVAADVVAVLTARIAQAQGKTAAARQLLEKVASTESEIESPVFWQLLARLCWESGDDEAGLAAAKKFGQLTEDPLAAARMHAARLAETSRFDEAEQLLRKAMQTTADEEFLARVVLQTALVLRGAGKSDEAREILDQALAKDPDSVPVIDQLAGMAWEERKWAELEKHEERLAELLPGQASVASFYRGIRLASQAENRADPRLTEAAQISDLLEDRRPDWPLTHILAGEVAGKRGVTNEALTEFQAAWQLGMVRPSVANEILRLLTQLGRYDEAIAFANQIRDYISDSSQLFDQVIPFVEGEEYQQQAVKIASDWVRREPKSAIAWARLGRVLVLSDEGDPSGERLKQSRKAFRRAIDLKPGDVNVWLAAFSSYFSDKSKRNEASRIVEQFAAQTEVEPLERAFVLAQFYRALQLPDKASQQYRQVISLADQAEPNVQVPLLISAGGFYAVASPPLAEKLYRRALAIDPESVGARIVLAGFLLDRRGNLDEIEQLISGITEGPKVNDAILDQVRRTRAGLALLREDKERITASIPEIESILRPSTNDRFILASLYQKVDRIKPALDVLTSLVENPSAQPRELEAFIRFWQDHFLDSGQFESDKDRAYERLVAQSGILVPTFRLRLREKQMNKGEGEPIKWEDVVAAMQESKRSVPESSTPETQLRDFMIVLLQEDFVDHAIRLLESPPTGINPDQTPLAMCSALLLARVTEGTVMEKVRGPLAEQVTKRSEDKEFVGRYSDLLMTCGEVDEALENYRQVLETSTEKPWQTMNNLAVALMNTADGKNQALTVVDQALADSPDNSSLLDTKAMILRSLGKSKEALGILQQLHKAGSTSAGSLLHLAVIYEDMGKSDAAKSAMVDALAMGCRQQILDKRDRSDVERLTQTFNL